MQFLIENKLKLILKVNFKFSLKFSFIKISFVLGTNHNYDNIHITYFLYICTGIHRGLSNEGRKFKQKK